MTVHFLAHRVHKRKKKEIHSPHTIQKNQPGHMLGMHLLSLTVFLTQAEDSTITFIEANDTQSIASTLPPRKCHKT